LKQHAAELSAKVRARRDDLGDERVIAAKRYLDGLVRAAEAAQDTSIPAGFGDLTTAE